MKNRSPEDESGVGASVLGHGHDPHDRRYGHPPYDDTPWSLYYYHITEERGGLITAEYKVASVDEEIRKSDIEDLTRRLALNARRPPREQFPIGRTVRWRDVVWRRRSYFVAVIDIPGTVFKEPAMIFKADWDGYPNYTFYDGENFSVEVGASTLSAFYCMNHMKRDQAGTGLGKGLPVEHRKYSFDFNTEPTLERRGTPVYPDSGGTNTGPPIPP
jgi:hypothetical protein